MDDDEGFVGAVRDFEAAIFGALDGASHGTFLALEGAAGGLLGGHEQTEVTGPVCMVFRVTRGQRQLVPTR